MATIRVPEEAERLFSQVFHNLTQRHAEVTTFRSLAALGQPAAAAALTAKNYRFALSILNDPQYDRFFRDRKAAVAFFGGPEAMGSELTAQQLKLFNSAVDAASLVFIHSAVDSAISDLCMITYIIDPGRWRPFVEAQKVTLAEASSNSADDLWKAKLDAHLEALEKESLRKRTERLFAVCKPPQTFDPMENFKYDVDSLERLDKLRQSIIHGSGPTAIPNCDAELEYLVKVGLYFFGMVNSAFDVKINPLHAIGLQLPVAQGPSDQTP